MLECLQIDWKQFFQLMFRNTNITLDFEDADAEIVIKDKVHIFTVLNALAKTPPRVIGKDIFNFLPIFIIGRFPRAR